MKKKKEIAMFLKTTIIPQIVLNFFLYSADVGAANHACKHNFLVGIESSRTGKAIMLINTAAQGAAASLGPLFRFTNSHEW